MPWPMPYYVHRCAHVGNAFVVDIRNATPGSGYCAIDFVIDVTPGGAEFVDGYEAMNEAEAEAIWDRLYRRLTTGAED